MAKCFYRVYVDYIDRSEEKRTKMFWSDRLYDLIQQMDRWKESNSDDDKFEVTDISKVNIQQVEETPIPVSMKHTNRSMRQEGGSDADMITSFRNRY